MKRDMDLIRRIAFAVEALPADEYMQGLPEVDDERFVFHVELMEEAGLLKANIQTYTTGPSAVFVERLTWAGCEFVDAVRSDTLWKKAKDNVLKPTASFTFDILREWLKVEMLQGFTTLRSLGN